MTRMGPSLVSEAGMYWWTPSVPIIKWWSTFKLAVFGSSSDSSLPPLLFSGGGLVCESVGKGRFAVSPFWKKVVQWYCHTHDIRLQVSLLRSWEVRRLLLNLDSYGVTPPLGMFPIFLKRAADVLATRLSVVFLWFIRLGSFPACWSLAIVTPQFRKVHLLPQWPITDKFPEHLHILPDVFERPFEKCPFEKCLRSVSRVAAGRFGIMRKS